MNDLLLNATSVSSGQNATETPVSSLNDTVSTVSLTALRPNYSHPYTRSNSLSLFLPLGLVSILLVVVFTVLWYRRRKHYGILGSPPGAGVLGDGSGRPSIFPAYNWRLSTSTMSLIGQHRPFSDRDQFNPVTAAPIVDASDTVAIHPMGQQRVDSVMERQLMDDEEGVGEVYRPTLISSTNPDQYTCGYLPDDQGRLRLEFSQFRV